MSGFAGGGSGGGGAVSIASIFEFLLNDADSKMLVCPSDNGAYSTLRDANSFAGVGSGSGYQVPVGKKFEVFALILSGVEDTLLERIGYGDDDVGFSGGNPSNEMWSWGGDTPGNPFSVFAALVNNSSTGQVDDSTLRVLPWKMTIPAEKYPAAGYGAGTPNGCLLMIGREVDA